MTLPEQLTRLLEMKATEEQAETDYEAQRLAVRQSMEEANLETVEHEGFRISRTDDRVVRTFDLRRLREQLAAQGLAEDDITRILQDSRTENLQKGVLRISKLPEK